MDGRIWRDGAPRRKMWPNIAIHAGNTATKTDHAKFLARITFNSWRVKWRLVSRTEEDMLGTRKGKKEDSPPDGLLRRRGCRGGVGGGRGG
jgi:hypothetical protein